MVLLGVACAATPGPKSVGGLYFSLGVDGEVDVVVVDWLGRVDSMRSNGTGSGGIPGCRRYEEVLSTGDSAAGEPREVTTFIALRGADYGAYTFWLRSREEDGRVSISWFRWNDGGSRACEHGAILTGWNATDWYRWVVETRPVTKTDTCGVKAGKLERAVRPKRWGKP
jgi:hypothetical protein